MTFTNDVPDMDNVRRGKWEKVCVELLESNFRAVKIEAGNHEAANRVRNTVHNTVKRNGLPVQPTQRGNAVYLVRTDWGESQK